MLVATNQLECPRARGRADNHREDLSAERQEIFLHGARREVRLEQARCASTRRGPPSSSGPQCRDSCDLKNRKKFDPTSIARPAASASSIAFDDVMPRVPSAFGQSLRSITSTGLTCHQIAPVFTSELS